MAKVNTQSFLDSAAKASAAIAKIRPINNIQGLTVVSFSDEEKEYKVSLRNRKLAGEDATFIASCDCPQYNYRRQVCKHMIAVSLEEDIPLLALARDMITHVNKEYKKKLAQVQQLTQQAPQQFYGPPGVGKTDLMRDIALRNNIEIIDLN